MTNDPRLILDVEVVHKNDEESLLILRHDGRVVVSASVRMEAQALLHLIVKKEVKPQPAVIETKEYSHG